MKTFKLRQIVSDVQAVQVNLKEGGIFEFQAVKYPVRKSDSGILFVDFHTTEGRTKLFHGDWAFVDQRNNVFKATDAEFQLKFETAEEIPTGEGVTGSEGAEETPTKKKKD